MVKMYFGIKEGGNVSYMDAQGNQDIVGGVHNPLEKLANPNPFAG